MGRIITIVCILFLILGGVWWLRNVHQANHFDGTVTRRDGSVESSSAISDDEQTATEVHPTPSRSDAPGTINTEPVRRDDNDAKDAQFGDSSPGGPLVQDPDVVNRDHDREARDVPPPPPDDSEPQESPDGFRFGGSGVYQWYRQGDITYRVNTHTGASCIIYATMAEWRKPDVYRHGCRER